MTQCASFPDKIDAPECKHRCEPYAAVFTLVTQKDLYGEKQLDGCSSEIDWIHD